MTWLLPPAASAHAGQIDTIMLLVHALMLALAIGWGGVFVYSLVRFRRSKNPKADYHGARSRYSTYTEAGIVIAELILLVGFSIPAWATRVRDLPPAHEAVVVRVVAEQFAWNVHYPGRDGLFGRLDPTLLGPDNPLGLDPRSPEGRDDVATINEIVVPLGRPVIVHLSAKDVIHSFGVPAMRIKQDANPGIMTPVWFTPTALGTFDVACSQLCGLGHYRMKAILRVVAPEEFERWLANGGA
ncbi:MAG TPA: cytochrome c oxidase subunit II [Vicinamibacterales bacterium]